MLTSQGRSLFQRESRCLGQREGGLYAQRARQAFDALDFGGGELEVVGGLEYARSGLLTLASAKTPPVNRVFGLDGGSSRTMVFRNGVVACANQALMACERRLLQENVPLEAHRTLAWVTHNRDVRAASYTRSESDDLVWLWRLQLTSDEVPSNATPQLIQELVKALADLASETQHAVRMTERLGLQQGDLLYLDGRLYPTRLYRFLLTTPGQGPEDIDLISNRDDWKHLIQLSITLIERALETDFLVLAVNKNPESRSILRFGADNSAKALWHDDRQWLSGLFENTPKDELGYTNWFVQRRHPSPRGGNSATTDVFQELKQELTLGLHEENYHIAFFYVYDPRVSAALRVETPRAMLVRYGSNALRLRVLSHIARGGGGVPGVIRMADAEARISQQEREALHRNSGLSPDWRFNHSRGAPR